MLRVRLTVPAAPPCLLRCVGGSMATCRYDAGRADVASLVAGFWEQLTRRMGGGGGGGGDAKAVRGSKGRVVPVAVGSGLALEELAAAEEEDSGIKAPLLLGAFSEEASEAPSEADAEGLTLAADGTPRKPGVKYDAWGRVML